MKLIDVNEDNFKTIFNSCRDIDSILSEQYASDIIYIIAQDQVYAQQVATATKKHISTIIEQLEKLERNNIVNIIKMQKKVRIKKAYCINWSVLSQNFVYRCILGVIGASGKIPTNKVVDELFLLASNDIVTSYVSNLVSNFEWDKTITSLFDELSANVPTVCNAMIVTPRYRFSEELQTFFELINELLNTSCAVYQNYSLAALEITALEFKK